MSLFAYGVPTPSAAADKAVVPPTPGTQPQGRQAPAANVEQSTLEAPRAQSTPGPAQRDPRAAELSYLVGSAEEEVARLRSLVAALGVDPNMGSVWGGDVALSGVAAGSFVANDAGAGRSVTTAGSVAATPGVVESAVGAGLAGAAAQEAEAGAGLPLEGGASPDLRGRGQVAAVAGGSVLASAHPAGLRPAAPMTAAASAVAAAATTGGGSGGGTGGADGGWGGGGVGDGGVGGVAGRRGELLDVSRAATVPLGAIQRRAFPVFDGRGESLDGWVQQAQWWFEAEVADGRPVSSAHEATYAFVSGTAAALPLFRAASAQGIQSFSELVKYLRTALHRTQQEQRDAVWARLRTLSATKATIAEYVHQFEDAARQLPEHEHSVVRTMLVLGLPEEYQELAGRYHTLAELCVAVLARFHRRQAKQQLRQGTAAAVSVMDGSTMQPHQVAAAAAQLPGVGGGRGSGTGQARPLACYHCKGPHYARNCPQLNEDQRRMYQSQHEQWQQKKQRQASPAKSQAQGN